MKPSILDIIIWNWIVFHQMYLKSADFVRIALFLNFGFYGGGPLKWSMFISISISNDSKVLW